MGSVMRLPSARKIRAFPGFLAALPNVGTYSKTKERLDFGQYPRQESNL